MSIYRIKTCLFLLLSSSLLFCSPVSATNGGNSSVSRVVSPCLDQILNRGRGFNSPQTLEGLFLALDAPITRNDPFFRLPRVDINFKNFPMVPAVKAQQVFVGNDGEGYFLFRRIGETWRRHGGTNFFAVESDPTWIISALGPRVAAFLGFRLIRSDLMYAPNSVLFNKRIAALNQLLKKKGFEEIPARWTAEIQTAVSPDGIKLSYSENYVRGFYFKNLVPFAPKEIVHDTSHHALDVLWTRDQLAPFKARLGAVVNFADFIRDFKFDAEEYPLLSVSRYREALIALLFQTQAKNKDNHSGTTPIIFFSDSPDESENNSFFRILRSHLGVEFTRLFTESFVVHFGTKYTVGQWFNKLIFARLIPLIENKSPDREGDYTSLQKLRAYTDRAYFGAIGELELMSNQLSVEMADLYRLFEKSDAKLMLELVLVEYDKGLNTVGGIASKDHPQSAVRRRAREFRTAIGE
jgi:hypothetical protein